MKSFVSVIGGGSYATALVKVLNDNQIPVHWWVRKAETAEYILKNGHNPQYLSSVSLNMDLIEVHTDLAAALNAAQVILLAIPSAFLHATIQHIPKELVKDKQWISVIKGIIPETDQVPAEYIHSHYDVEWENLAMLTGPSHAEEIALERLTFLTAPAGSQAFSQRICQWFGNEYIKMIPGHDLLGAEYSAVLKNVFSIAAGMYHGLGYGDNFHAFFLTNAIREIRDFLDVASPGKRDVNESAYLGDLMVTAYSAFSRNRTLGNMIGKGYSVKAALSEMNMIAEGYYATKSMYIIQQKFNITLPILDAVHKVLYQNESCTKVMNNLAISFK